MKCILCLFIDELVAPGVIATLCILCKIIKCTNSLQVYLQGACLNWCDVPRDLNNVLQTLQLKAERPSKPKSLYFGRIEQFIGIARKSAGGRFNLRSYKSFDIKLSHKAFIKPVMCDLIEKNKNAFDVPEPLMRFSVLVPGSLPQGLKQLEEYGKKKIEDLVIWYLFMDLLASTRTGWNPYNLC